MGKHKKKSSSYKPQITKNKNPNGISKPTPVPIRKLSEVSQHSNGAIRKNSQIEFVDADITIINVIEKKTIEQSQLKIVSDLKKFDFNSKELFNPDQDSHKVGIQCWNQIINPIQYQRFDSEIRGKCLLVIQERNQTGYSFDQIDSEDNFLSLSTIKNYVQVNSGKLKYGDDIEFSRCIDGKRHLIRTDGDITTEVFNDFLEKQQLCVKVQKPQESSASIAKMICLSEEVLQSVINVQGFMQVNNQGKPIKQKNVFELMKSEVFIMQVEGQSSWKVHSEGQEIIGDNKLWGGSLSKGDFLYIPTGQQVSYKLKGELSSFIMMTISNNSWMNVMQDTFKSAIEVLHKMNLPSDYLEMNDKNYLKYCSIIDSLCKNLKNKDWYKKSMTKQLKHFQLKRQAPQEILAAIEMEGEEDEDMEEEKSVQFPTPVPLKFKSVKLASKYAAFLIEKDDEQWLYYSSQNQRNSKENSKQKLRVPEFFVSSLQLIIKAYPKYVSEKDFENFKEISELLSELAYLQVLVVK